MAEAVEQTRRSPAQLFALVFGLVYLAVGVVGFFVTGFDDFAKDIYDEELLIFALNPLHNLVHIVIGLLWVGGSATHKGAKGVNMLLGVALAAVAALGFFDVLEWLAIEGPGSPDNWLHLGTALLAIYFGSVGARGPASTVTV